MLFSIIMCTYNSAKTLAQALESVRSQTYAEWELLILDNGSRDDTVQVLKKYQAADSRIHVFYRNDNIGWCMGIRDCLDRASGEYMMFLGADDFLPDGDVLETVAKQIGEHAPDIVWTGCGFAVLEDGQYQLVTRTLPEYHVYDREENRLKVLSEIMQQVYYNSVMHYVNIDFLKRHGIDFYEPFYGDYQGMTEALCRADKMVVLDKMAYILVVNTSQTASVTGFDYDIGRQWNSVKSILPGKDEIFFPVLQGVAERILGNLAAMCQDIVLGGALRDRRMNPIEKTLPERFLKAEEWISSEAFGEMMYYAGRESFARQLIGAAGILYWEAKRIPTVAKQMQRESGWLAEFVQAAMEERAGQIQWRSSIGRTQGACILRAVADDRNPHRIGCELVLNDAVQFEDIEVRGQIRQLLQEYMESV